MTLTNADVRSHLRKGEQAVKTLESLGWVFDKGHWKESLPQTALSVLQATVKEMFLAESSRAYDAGVRKGATLPRPAKAVEAGDAFMVTHRPSLALMNVCPDWAFTTFTALDVGEGLQGHVVRFEYKGFRYWQPLETVRYVGN